MSSKIYWIDNLRGIACLMVVMIHTTAWYVTNAASVSTLDWGVANLLNSASRVSVPLFFMISGYLFFGERSAQPRHLSTSSYLPQLTASYHYETCYKNRFFIICGFSLRLSLSISSRRLFR